MKHRAIGLASAAILVGVCSVANALEDKVEQISRSFQVTYPDKSTEIVLVEWTALVTTNYERHGRASTLEHPIDDRSCTWSSTGAVNRQGYFVSKSGVRAPITDSLKVFTQVHRDSRGPKNIVQAAGGYHQTCGDVMGKIQADHQAAINNMKGTVQNVVNEDAADAEANLKTLLKAVKVEPGK